MFSIFKQNPKKGKHCFEIKMADKTYALSAETEAEMEDWIKVLDKVRTAAETLSQISLDRQRGKNVGGVVGTLSHMFNILIWVQDGDFVLPKQSQRSRSILKDGSRFW